MIVTIFSAVLSVTILEIMLRIDQEATESPDLLKTAPHSTPVRRLDEAGAARNLNIRYFQDK